MAAANDMRPVFMTETELADLLGLSIRTLNAWRSRGEGPAFHRFRRIVRYRRSDVDAWIEANKHSATVAQ